MRPTSPLWYLVAFLIALGGSMVATVVAAGAWDPVREATITPIATRADAAGKSIAVFTDIVQSDRDVACHAIGRDKKVVDVKPAAIDVTVDDDGNQWHLIGMLTNGSNGVAVRCGPADKRVDNASYGYATVEGFASRANRGKGIAVIGAAIGAGFAGYVFYCRRLRRKELLHEPA